MQLGYIVWWLLAGLGLGALAAAFPFGFLALTLAGVIYLAWLGIRSLREAGTDTASATRDRSPKTMPFREGVLVALSNPKSLIYVVALLPPFVDVRQPVVSQLVALALLGIAIDLAIGAVYIATGSRLAIAMAQPRQRLRFDRAVGVLFICIALGILADLAMA